MARDWLNADINRARKPDLDAWIRQAVDDGEPRPMVWDVNTNPKRRDWLRRARMNHWDRQHAAPDTHGSVNTGPRGSSTSGLTASECNAFLRTLPVPPPYPEKCTCPICMLEAQA